MWTTDDVGIATLQSDVARWEFDARGGSFGIVIRDAAKRGCVKLEPVDQDLLPIADEQFVRGCSWHVNYPQGDCSYALRLVFTPIATTETRLVLETTVAIQTNLLDTHPRLDVVAEGSRRAIQPADSTPIDSAIRGAEASAGSPPISLCNGNGHSVAVLLAPYDSPFTSDQSNESALRLRLFGDFLEKGVIRKARPWIVLNCSDKPPSDAELRELLTQLQQRPLPLTA